MRRPGTAIWLHGLVAIALSLVINFSYLLLPIITDQGIDSRSLNEEVVAHGTGVFHLTRDLHGYIVCDCPDKDSTYVSAGQVRRLKLQHLDTLCFTTLQPHGETFTKEQIAEAHKQLDRIVMRNGEPFDFDTLYDRPSHTIEFLWQITYYAIFSFLLIIIFTLKRFDNRRVAWNIIRRAFVAMVITAVAIYFAPVMSFKDGAMRIVLFFDSNAHTNAYIVVLTKSLFMLVVTILYVCIYRLMQQRQSIVIENERLKTEYLATRYNMLMGQINPHFFFNSLNSLAMLVRGGDEPRALEYIDQLSYTFRYILQGGQNTTTTLREEIDFARSYAYLFKIRYADKLFFDFDIEEQYLTWRLPALSLQPLLGNAVKHNAITTRQPLHVAIRVVDGKLEVENPKYPKLDVEPSTGIGLANLSSRWQIITGRDIEIIEDEHRFMVRLPLEPQK